MSRIFNFPFSVHVDAHGYQFQPPPFRATEVQAVQGRRPVQDGQTVRSLSVYDFGCTDEMLVATRFRRAAKVAISISIEFVTPSPPSGIAPRAHALALGKTLLDVGLKLVSCN